MAGPSDLTFRIERGVAAPRARVFAALTTPETLRRWWGPRGFSAPGVAFDARVTGRYRIAMEPPEGEVFHVTGSVIEIAPPSRLALTFRWEEPHPDDRETRVAIALEERGETTWLTVTQGPFATAARRELHHAGWSESLERLDEVLSRPG